MALQASRGDPFHIAFERALPVAHGAATRSELGEEDSWKERAMRGRELTLAHLSDTDRTRYTDAAEAHKLPRLPNHNIRSARFLKRRQRVNAPTKRVLLPPAPRPSAVAGAPPDRTRRPNIYQISLNGCRRFTAARCPAALRGRTESRGVPDPVLALRTSPLQLGTRLSLALRELPLPPLR